MYRTLIVKEFAGLVPYLNAWQSMQILTNNRDYNTEDELWLLEHNDVFTQGQAGKQEHIIKPTNIPIIQTDRGGQVTYHGPGQLIVYFLIDIRRKKIQIRHFIREIENCVIELMKDFNIQAYGKIEAPGVYVRHNNVEYKLASLGLKVRNGRTYHGLGLNVYTNLEYFAYINPCGYQGLKMINVESLVHNLTIAEIKQGFISIFASKFSYAIA